MRITPGSLIALCYGKLLYQTLNHTTGQLSDSYVIAPESETCFVVSVHEVKNLRAVMQKTPRFALYVVTSESQKTGFCWYNSAMNYMYVL